MKQKTVKTKDGFQLGHLMPGTAPGSSGCKSKQEPPSDKMRSLIKSGANYGEARYAALNR